MTFIFMCCPSEPALAIAGACTLLKNDVAYLTAFETLIRELVLQGIVQDRGASGELSSCLLLLLTRDYATAPEMSPSTERLFVTGSREEQVVTTVTLWMFVTMLLGDI